MPLSPPLLLDVLSVESLVPHAASPAARTSPANGTSSRVRSSLAHPHSCSRRHHLQTLPFLSRARFMRSLFNSQASRRRAQRRRGREPIRLVHHQRQRAEQLRPLAEHPGHDLDLLGGARDRVAARRLAQRPEQHLAGGAQIAADDDALGVQQVAQVRDRDADRPPGVADEPLGRRVARGAQLEQPAGRDLLRRGWR